MQWLGDRAVQTVRCNISSREYCQYFIITINGAWPLKSVNHCEDLTVLDTVAYIILCSS